MEHYFNKMLPLSQLPSYHSGRDGSGLVVVTLLFHFLQTSSPVIIIFSVIILILWNGINGHNFVKKRMVTREKGDAGLILFLKWKNKLVKTYRCFPFQHSNNHFKFTGSTKS